MKTCKECPKPVDKYKCCSKNCGAKYWHRTRKKIPKIYSSCLHCKEERQLTNINRHEKECYLNPKNIKHCANCQVPLKNWKWATCCGHICSSNYEVFAKKRVETRKKNNPAFAHYTSICFKEHGKKCIVCGESKIVAVHHVNENHKDNRTENLVPLCPTHHQYFHSRYKNEVAPIIEKFIKEYLDNK